MKKYIYIYLPIPLGIAWVALVLFFFTLTKASATTSERFVSTNGRDINPSGPPFIINDCTSNSNPCQTIQHAIDYAGPNDTIYVASGVYTSSGSSVITITKNIHLLGGWDGGLDNPPRLDPAVYPTMLDGEFSRRGIIVMTGISTTISGFVIANASSTSMGGGLYSEDAHLILSNSVITNNHATNYGGGIAIVSGSATVTSCEIVSNSVTYGGGGLYLGYNSEVILDGNRVVENKSDYGGGVEVDDGVLTATANIISQNESSSALMISGASGSVHGENNVISNNSGYGIQTYSAPVHLFHSTIVSNSLDAINLAYNATLELTNTLIAYNGMGIEYTTGCQLSGSNNLFWDNHTNYFSGTNYLVGNPMLAGDGYHLSNGSPAIDAGINVVVVDDIDGNKRPILSGFDIGADEWLIKVFLPLILKNNP